MSQIKLSPSASGTGIFTIESPSSNTNRTISLPDNTGTILTNATTTGFPAGSVLQVVSATKTDTLSTSSTSYTDITGLSVSITPTSASSKILIIYSVNVGWDEYRGLQLRLMRDSTAICIGDAAGSRTRSSNTTFADTTWTFSTRAMWCLSNNFLDSPSTTSATTYKLQIGAIGEVDGTNVYVNRSSTDGDSSVYGRTASTITVMEIAA